MSFTFKYKIMKKIFTLIMVIGSITFLSAQAGFKNYNRSYNENKAITKMPSKNNPGFNDRNTKDYKAYSFSSRDRDAAIEMIEREYAYKIGSVKRDRYMKPGNKTKQIRLLEKQKALAIKEVRLKFEQNNSRSSAYHNSKKRY